MINSNKKKELLESIQSDKIKKAKKELLKEQNKRHKLFNLVKKGRWNRTLYYVVQPINLMKYCLGIVSALALACFITGYIGSLLMLVVTIVDPLNLSFQITSYTFFQYVIRMFIAILLGLCAAEIANLVFNGYLPYGQKKLLKDINSIEKRIAKLNGKLQVLETKKKRN